MRHNKWTAAKFDSFSCKEKNSIKSRMKLGHFHKCEQKITDVVGFLLSLQFTMKPYDLWIGLQSVCYVCLIADSVDVDTGFSINYSHFTQTAYVYIYTVDRHIGYVKHVCCCVIVSLKIQALICSSLQPMIHTQREWSSRLTANRCVHSTYVFLHFRCSSFIFLLSIWFLSCFSSTTTPTTKIMHSINKVLDNS